MNLAEFSNYETNRLAYWENNAVIKSAHQEGLEQGLEQGLLRKAFIVVKKCLLKGYSVQLTAEIADVSIEYVEKVANDLKIKGELK